MRRTIIVGDVHGCHEELETLLDRVAFSEGDQLVLVGDLVARGPDPTKVFDLVRHAKGRFVRGNHEEKLLGWRRAVREGKRKKGDLDALGRMHREVAEQLREDDWDAMDQAPLAMFLPHHGVVVVHAGILPGIGWSQQRPETLLHIRGVTSDGKGTDAKDAKRLWGTVYVGGPHIVFGHNAMNEPQLHPYATGIDTGCVYGGRLTALVVGAHEKLPRGDAVRENLVSVPARRTYFDWTKKKSG
jgi:hypothetical protein